MNLENRIFSFITTLIFAPSLLFSIEIIELRKNDRNGFPLYFDSIVTVSGIITASTQYGGRGPGFIQDHTAGVAIYDTIVRSLKIGDSVTITGKCTVYYGLTELKHIRYIIHSRLKTRLPEKKKISEILKIDTLNNYIEEEGKLVEIDSVIFVNLPADTFAGRMNYSVVDTYRETLTVRIDSTLKDIIGKKIPRNYFTLRGIVSQYKRTPPFFGGYQILPRNATDVGLPLQAIAEVIKDEDQNTIPDLLGKIVNICGVITVPFGIFSKVYTDIYIQDTTAGVNLFDFKTLPFELGDSALITGIVAQYKGKTQLKDFWGIVLKKNCQKPLPRELKVREINQEAYEGSLVKISGVRANAFILRGNESYPIFDTTGLSSIFVKEASDAVGVLLPKDTFTIIGIKSQYTTAPSPPFNTGYQLLPRFKKDFSRNLTEELPILPISEIQKPGEDGYSSRYEGEYVHFKGRVIVPAYLLSLSTTKSLYLLDQTSGIFIYGADYLNSQEKFLDTVGVEWEVIGKVTEYNGLTEITQGYMWVIDSQKVNIEPLILPPNVFLREELESKFIELTGVIVNLPEEAGDGYNLLVQNLDAGINVRILKSSNIPLADLIKDKKFTFRGVVGQYDREPPFNTGYQLIVRFPSDIQPVIDTTLPSSVLILDSIAPNPFNPSLGQLLRFYFNSPLDMKISLTIYNLEGKRVRTLLKNAYGGYKEIFWDGKDDRRVNCPAGIYVVKLEGKTKTGKTYLIKKPVVLGTRL